MQIFINFLKKYWILCIVTLLLACVNQIFSMLDPYIFKLVIDNYATKPELYGQAEFFRGVSWLLLDIVGVAFVSRVAKNFQDYFLNSISGRVGADLYREGVAHALSMPYRVFEDERSGEILSKLGKARTDTEKLISSAVNIIFVSAIGFIFVAVYSISIYWPIALVYFLAVPIVGGLSYVFSRRIKDLQKVIATETAQLSGSMTESLRNIELVKSLGLKDAEISRLSNTTDSILKLELKKLRFIRSLSFVQGTVINFLRTAILFFLIYLIYVKIISFGEFFSLYVYSFYIFGPLGELGNVISVFREAEASMLGYSQIMNIPVEKTPIDSEIVDDISLIQFKNVGFSYGEFDTKRALRNFTFSVKKGETIAFVGPSGSGKSSIVKLLVGLYDPREGEILYNSTSYKNVNKEILRSQIGYVTQDTQLFAGTIKDNLLFANNNATDEEMLDSLTIAKCDKIIKKSGEGLLSRIGEGGIKLSGGERQRLSIARALLRKPKLLIFDEATSALDSLTEEGITETIKELRTTNDIAMVLIAHRLGTVMHADRIYVLEKGRMVEAGTHQALLAQKGLYYAMWRQQIGER